MVKRSESGFKGSLEAVARPLHVEGAPSIFHEEVGHRQPLDRR